jgi:hypothetical protein
MALGQPLEVGSTRETLQNDVLGGTLSPQVVLRIGWAQEDPLPPTPRRPVEEIIGEPPPVRRCCGNRHVGWAGQSRKHSSRIRPKAAMLVLGAAANAAGGC